MPLTVTELVAQLKRAVETEVGSQCVVGEIGSCKKAASGHIYFTIKDSVSQLQCVLYRFQAAACRTRLQEGMLAELTGRVTVWEGRGSLQFIASSVREAGIGSLQQQFEALKEKLKREGIFDAARKKPLPAFPKSVGLITSAAGAVIQDMRHRLESRAPWMRTYLLPVPVQGKGAELSIAAAIRMWNAPDRYGLPEVDYLVIARGGGSLEDLWCFNEEAVARAIAASRLPIVSAVGHETDFTIADFAADLRAPTPTAAIELTTPDKAALDTSLQQMSQGLRRRLAAALETARLHMEIIAGGPLGSPLGALAPFAQALDEQEETLRQACRERLRQAAQKLDLLKARLSTRTLRAGIAAAHNKLDSARQSLLSTAHAHLAAAQALVNTHTAHLSAASPQNALDRGFALVRTPSGTLARNAAELPPGSTVEITLSQGSLAATVTANRR